MCVCLYVCGQGMQLLRRISDAGHIWYACNCEQERRQRFLARCKVSHSAEPRCVQEKPQALFCVRKASHSAKKKKISALPCLPQYLWLNITQSPFPPVPRYQQRSRQSVSIIITVYFQLSEGHGFNPLLGHLIFI